MGKIKVVNKSFETEKVADAIDTVKTQVGGFGADLISQLLGTDSGKNYTEGSVQKSPDKPNPATGQVDIFHADKHKKTESHKPSSEKTQNFQKKEAALDYQGVIIKSSERAIHTEMYEIKQKMREIMAELQRLIASSKVLKTEFADVNLQQEPAEAGEYHLNFFSWVLLTIRAARQKVEDSGAWLKVVKSKKNRGYWGMFKKHGTTFGLSNERVVATQTG